MTCSRILSIPTRLGLALALLTALGVASGGLAPPAKGGKLGYTATGVFANGTVEPITSHVTWTSTNPRAAVVSPQGVVTGLSRGSALVFARFGQTPVVPAAVVVR